MKANLLLQTIRDMILNLAKHATAQLVLNKNYMLPTQRLPVGLSIEKHCSKRVSFSFKYEIAIAGYPSKLPIFFLHRG